MSLGSGPRALARSVIFAAGICAIEIADILSLFRCGHGCGFCLCNRMVCLDSKTRVSFASALGFEDLDVVVNVALLLGEIFVVFISVHELLIFAPFAANF